jgi:hypothetical protein
MGISGGCQKALEGMMMRRCTASYEGVLSLRRFVSHGLGSFV